MSHTRTQTPQRYGLRSTSRGAGSFMSNGTSCGRGRRTQFFSSSSSVIVKEIGVGSSCVTRYIVLSRFQNVFPSNSLGHARDRGRASCVHHGRDAMWGARTCIIKDTYANIWVVVDRLPFLWCVRLHPDDHASLAQQSIHHALRLCCPLREKPRKDWISEQSWLLLSSRRAPHRRVLAFPAHLRRWRLSSAYCCWCTLTPYPARAPQPSLPTSQSGDFGVSLPFVKATAVTLGRDLPDDRQRYVDDTLSHAARAFAHDDRAQAYFLIRELRKTPPRPCLVRRYVGDFPARHRHRTGLPRREASRRFHLPSPTSPPSTLTALLATVLAFRSSLRSSLPARRFVRLSRSCSLAKRAEKIFSRPSSSSSFLGLCPTSSTPPHRQGLSHLQPTPGLEERVVHRLPETECAMLWQSLPRPAEEKRSLRWSTPLFTKRNVAPCHTKAATSALAC